MLAQEIDAIVDVTVNVVVECQKTIGAIRIAPVDEVDLLAALHQTTDQRSVDLQIGHVGPIDQCIDD